MFNCSYPNIYNFIDILKDIQIDTYIKIRSKEVIKKRKITIEKDIFLRQEMLKYENHSISRFEFFKSISNKFLPCT